MLKTDVFAAQRATDTRLGWFADPIYKGHYPASLKNMHYLISGIIFLVTNAIDLPFAARAEGGSDELSGNVKTTFIRSDGSLLGTQGELLSNYMGPRTFAELCLYSTCPLAAKL